MCHPRVTVDDPDALLEELHSKGVIPENTQVRDTDGEPGSSGFGIPTGTD
jgi:hypothetical protein